MYIWAPPPQIVRIIVGEYEQRAVHKRYNVVGNGPNSVLELQCDLSC